MKCEFEYCVYNNNFDCLLREIHVNAFGMCDDCILISLDEAFLNDIKEKQLTELK